MIKLKASLPLDVLRRSSHENTAIFMDEISEPIKFTAAVLAHKETFAFFEIRHATHGYVHLLLWPRIMSFKEIVFINLPWLVFVFNLVL